MEFICFGYYIFGIFNFIVTKYFIYNIVDTDPPIGDAGEIGSIGRKWENYFTETIAERCYVDLLNNLENEYQEIKKTNKIDFDLRIAVSKIIF